jgi:SAM-dependent methyltransferase
MSDRDGDRDGDRDADPRDDATRARWADELVAAARAHWTPARERATFGAKQLAITPSESPVLLRALGLLHRDATMPPDRVRKFLQINHVVRLVERAVRELSGPPDSPVRIADAGCGRSYLTLLLAHVARTRWHRRLEVLGIDRDPALIAECRRRAALARLDDAVTFRVADLATLDPVELGAPDAIFALHACDTATDDAIALGVRTRARLIAVAPCCQAELARAWSTRAAPASGFAPVHTAPHLRREIAAHVTDAMRVVLLRAAGYATTPMEFIAAEHTQKNTLIRAVQAAPDPAAREAYLALVASTGGCGIALADRISVGVDRVMTDPR